MVMRATRGETFQGGSYSKLAAIQIGFLASLPERERPIEWNEEYGYWTVDFEKMIPATRTLAQWTLRHYAQDHFQETDEAFQYYITGAGFQHLHRDRLQAVMGGMPSVLFDYEVTGLD
ncbi:MAG: hypothetical protein HYV02_01765 [Deltaproteobacteria bacterium]|nr:hypothetical protein [Deltaproteobacteria bacterium]